MKQSTSQLSASNGTYILIALEQIEYSRNGCPRWRMTMVGSLGEPPNSVVTASGASSAYSARPYESDIGKRYQVELRPSKNGKFVAKAWKKL